MEYITRAANLCFITAGTTKDKIKIVFTGSNKTVYFVLVYYNETRADIEQKLTQVDIRVPSIE